VTKPTKEAMRQNFPLCCEGADQIRETLGDECPIRMVYAAENGKEIGRKSKEGVAPNLHTFVVEKKRKR